MSQLQEVYIVAAVRTPVGKAPRGILRHARPDDLLAHVLRGVVNTCPELDPSLIGDVIAGCAMPEAEQGLNVARMATLLAGLPDSIPAVTVNRFCASGLQAVAWAADRIRLGEAEVMIGAGVESMSQIPMGGHKPAFNPAVFTNDANVGIAYGMGLTAEKVAAQWQVSREAQDQFALSSHQKAVTAIDSGAFAAEILPYTVRHAQPAADGQTLALQEMEVMHDEGPRRDAALESMAKLRPAFALKGSVTAGNSSQTSDGAAAVLLMSESMVKKLGVTPMARFVSYAVAGVPPEIMGIGPIHAVPKALQLAGLKTSDLGWIELNEAFAAQSLAVMQGLELNPAVVNPLGGAIALGHPLGATGAIRTATLVHGLKRQQQRYGMVTMCIGTGMGAAAVFEAV